MEPFDPQTTYLAVDGTGGANALPVDDSFWPDLMAGKYPQLDHGWLVGAFAMDADWETWEMHPAGEEILTLLSGRVEMVVEEGAARRIVTLLPGMTFVMPRGAWHRGLVREPSVMLAITYGRGTEHRPA